jgi:hypothetical protein
VLIRWIVLGLVLAGAGACQRKPAGDDSYFPLAAGRTWIYAMTRDGMEEGEEPVVLKVESLGPEEVSGVRVTREKIEMGGDEHFLFVGIDERGVFRYATQSPGEGAPSLDAERDYFLSTPLTVSRSWQGKGAPTFIDVVDTPVEIESTVVSTSDTVRTPAGEFTDCVKIKVTGKAEVRDEEEDEDEEAADAADGEQAEELDPVSGTFTLEEQTWYAKDVGVVKSVIVETFASAIDDQRIEVTTELQSFTR